MTLPPLPECHAVDYGENPGFSGTRLWNANQMKAYGQQCREAALEDAARLVEKYFDVNEPWMNPHEIRELK